MSVEAISALERGARRAPQRQTIALLSNALGLTEHERGALEATANRARARSLRSPDPNAPSANQVPAPLTSLVGREADVSAIVDLLGKHRLLTITGAGGVGKTRAALEVAGRMRQAHGLDVCFADLSHLGRESDISQRLAAAMPRSDRPVLVIIDSCEHLIANVAATVRTLLGASSQLTILATSRERLGMAGEAVYRLAPLSAAAAIQLFVDRAGSADPGSVLRDERLGLVPGICDRLDGLPLAIELAAARVPTLGFAALSARLTERFVLSTGARDVPPRQRTMFATAEWSWNLLNVYERTLLGRLSIFPGTVRLEDAEAVCTGGLLASADIAGTLTVLVEKSLVHVISIDDTNRFKLLEFVRAYGLEQLADSGELTELAKRHARWAADREDGDPITR